MLGRYWHTVRFLRPGQVAGRLWFHAYRPRPDLSAAPPARVMPGRFGTPLGRAPALMAPEVFRLLNVEGACRAPADWQPSRAAKLWTYHLHYFDDLNAREAAARATWHAPLLERWVAENSAGEGVGWEPYPVSRRIVNWVKWAAAGNRLPAACHHSLAVQARWLTQRLETHLLGNHLFANAKALVFAGLYFNGAEAERWYARGMELLAQQLPEQLLADGGHFELSTMYHALFLEDLLDLLNLLRAYDRQPPQDWAPRIAAMQRWLTVLSHPDGEIAFFNDAALAMAPRAQELREYALRLGVTAATAPADSATLLDASGYVRLTSGEAYLLCDCADVGPDHLPAHAHADSLSFEMSLGGQRIFVNSGVGEYGTGPERQRQRGTAAHNTVVVDGADSSEVWGGFRVARRARARIDELEVSPTLTLRAHHDGFQRLAGHNLHRRLWRLAPGCLDIEDEVTGPFSSAVAYFHLHPRIGVRAQESGALLLQPPGREALELRFAGAANVVLRPGSWHPEFGASVPNQQIAVQFAAGTLGTRLRWDERQ